jgi:hypothetical protein
MNELETDKVLELMCGYWPAMHKYFAANPNYRKLQCVAWTRGFNRYRVTYKEAIDAVDKYATSHAGIYEPKIANIIEKIKEARS